MSENHFNDKDVTEKDSNENNELNGLDGWLVLVGIGLVLAPLLILKNIVETLLAYVDLFVQISAEYELTSVGERLRALMIGEVIVQSILLLASVLLIFLFFKKHYLFPRVYMAVLLSALVLIGLDALIMYRFIAAEDMDITNVMTLLGRTLLQCLIWIPYMLMSKRVKNTFIEGRKTA